MRPSESVSRDHLTGIHPSGKGHFLPPEWQVFEPVLWQGKPAAAFWNIASLVSIGVNVLLFVMLILMGREIFTLKHLVKGQLIDGMVNSFAAMDQAHIVTTIHVQDTIQVNDQIPVVFNLPLKQETEVILTRDTPIKRATIFLNGIPVPLDLTLRKGTALNIALDLVVPVSQTVPVVLNVPVDLEVPVDIPLGETELHAPFVGLQNILLPYQMMLENSPDSWEETAFCGSLTNWLCKLFFGG